MWLIVVNTRFDTTSVRKETIGQAIEEYERMKKHYEGKNAIVYMAEVERSIKLQSRELEQVGV